MRTLPIVAVALLAATGAASADDKDVSGWYAGGFLSLDSAASITSECTTYSCSSDFSKSDRSPASGGAFVGRNFYIDGTLIGVEAAVGFSPKATSDPNGREIFSRNYDEPFAWQSGWYQPPGTVRYYENEGGTERYSRKLSYSYQNRATPTISARMGKQIGDWLLFGKVGAGVAFIKETITQDDSDSVYCGRTRQRQVWEAGAHSKTYYDACINPYSGAVTKETNTFVAPVGVFGAGVEKHFARSFVRLEGEIQHVFSKGRFELIGDEDLTTVSAKIGFGVRF